MRRPLHTPQWVPHALVLLVVSSFTWSFDLAARAAEGDPVPEDPATQVIEDSGEVTPEETPEDEVEAALTDEGGLPHGDPVPVVLPELPHRNLEPSARLLTERLAAVGIETPTYLGTPQCLACHSSRLPELERSHPGMQEFAPTGFYKNHSCESCHGPGSIHAVGGGNAEGILHPLKMPIDESNSICLECHVGTNWGTSVEWHSSPHAENNVACVTCHDPHRETPTLLRALDAGGLIGAGTDMLPITQMLALGPPFSGPGSDLQDYSFSDPSRPFAGTERFCFSCHTDTAIDFKLRSHHPIEQGALSCTSCHDPHMTEPKEADIIRKTNGLCESCHTDYAGPFAFNHAPIHDVTMGDGCITCHSPHGSPHDHLLRIDNRGLCLQCHVDKDTVGPDPHFAGTCWQSGCHMQVHGSQTSYLLLDEAPVPAILREIEVAH